MMRVVLAEDMSIVRAALIALLDLENDIQVVADASSGEDILRLCRIWQPDVAIIDIGLPGIDGISVAATLASELPGVRTLLLTGMAGPGTLRKALGARVDGIVMKDAPPGELVNAIRAVSAGRRYIDSHLSFSAWESGDCPLTDRELDVLQAVSQGLEVKEIADLVHLTMGTVRNYLTSVVSKLNARNRIDAIRIAREAGWL
jgi:two-component system, NarL family, response regulator DesR